MVIKIRFAQDVPFIGFNPNAPKALSAGSNGEHSSAAHAAASPNGSQEQSSHEFGSVKPMSSIFNSVKVDTLPTQVTNHAPVNQAPAANTNQSMEPSLSGGSMAGGSMDVKREGVAKKKTLRRVIFGILAVVALAVTGWRISLLKPASPQVESATIWPDIVKRGPLVRDVRGTGTLIPEDIQWIQAAFDSQVHKILARSGDDVRPDSVLLVLSNPQMEAEVVDYQWQTKQAEANLVDLRVRLQSQAFDQQALSLIHI